MTKALSMHLSTATRALGAAALLATAAGQTAHAADLSNFNSLTATEFRALSEDLGAALSYKALVPAEGLGVIGFDLGVAATGTVLKNREVFKKVVSGASVPGSLPVVSVRAVKGLPFDIDVGVALGAVPGTNVRTAGGELRWAFVGGGTLTPAIAVRAAINQVNGVDQLKLNTSSLDVSISKGFALFTPYAGAGLVRTKSEATITNSEQRRESFNQNKVFAGVNVNLGLLNVAVETDKTGEASSYGVKLGLRF